MSIFSSIMSKIFGGAAQAQGAPASPGTTGAAAPASAGSGTGSSAAPTAGSVDVEQIVSGMAAKKGEKLNWQTSIVDLMKALDLDSSFTARKQLAQELNYTGDMGDSAAMNIWLHKQVMTKLAENGGKVPDSLKA